MVELTVTYDDILECDELLDNKTRLIAYELAQAINKNCAEEIKNIKSIYADCPEFLKAKKYLNKKCKELWNVFGQENFTLPSVAFKALGISNQPSLEFLLGDSIRYFEKNNGSMTVQIIENILNNPKINYGMEDIYSYLVKLHKQEGCIYNSNTVNYLIKKHKYSKKKLTEIGVKNLSLPFFFTTRRSPLY